MELISTSHLFAKDTLEEAREHFDSNPDRVKIAVLVGAQEYDKLNNKWQKLKYPKKDALDIGNILKNKGQFDVVYRLPEQNNKKKYVKAKKNNIISIIKSYSSDNGYESLEDENKNIISDFVFYFSGHGFSITTNKGVKDYIIPEDADSKGDGVESSSCICIQDDLLPLFEKLANGGSKVMVFLDCCRTFKKNEEEDANSKKDKEDKEEVNKFYENLKEKENIVIAFSSKAGDASKEKDDYENGVFTEYLIRALNGEADAEEKENDYGYFDDYVSFYEAFMFVMNKLEYGAAIDTYKSNVEKTKLFLLTRVYYSSKLHLSVTYFGMYSIQIKGNPSKAYFNFISLGVNVKPVPMKRLGFYLDISAGIDYFPDLLFEVGANLSIFDEISYHSEIEQLNRKRLVGGVGLIYGLTKINSNNIIHKCGIDMMLKYQFAFYNDKNKIGLELTAGFQLLSTWICGYTDSSLGICSPYFKAGIFIYIPYK